MTHKKTWSEPSLQIELDPANKVPKKSHLPGTILNRLRLLAHWATVTGLAKAHI
jgi:hypothetical protein